MRSALILCLMLIALPAGAWEFTPTPVCTLEHETGEASVRVTYDPRQAEPYAIAITLSAPWPEAPVFAIRFDGTYGMTISSDRHKLSHGGTTLTVTDRGFGNVLDGIEFNRDATALAGEAAVTFPLDGAAGPMRAFRSCILPATA